MWLTTNRNWLSITATRSLNSSMTRSKPKTTFPGLLHFRPTMLGSSVSRWTIPCETPIEGQWVL